MAFLRHPKTQESQHVYFLGDIIDVFVGHQRAYFNVFKDFFEELKKLTSKGTVIHYCEGNHDFHLTKLFATFCKKNNIPLEMIQVHKDFHITKFWGKTFHFSHGDLVELGKPRYKLYRCFIKSSPLELVANYLVPYCLMDLMGNRVSQRSKKKNHAYFLDPVFQQMTRDHFRKSVRVAWEKERFDYIVSGHAHIDDIFIAPEGFTYLNAGPCFLLKKFLHITENRYEFISLEEKR
jgi:UDP-2,3-diacylglucosamine hydrolase